MNIQASVPLLQSPNRRDARSPEREPSQPPDSGDRFQSVAGAVRGAVHAATWAVPGAVAGYAASKGKAASEVLRHAMGWQGVAVGAAAGLAVGGPIGAGVGAAAGGIAGMMSHDFLWRSTSSGVVEGALKPILDGDASGARARTARSVRALRVGLQSSAKEAFRVGDEVGRGKVAGLQRGLAGLPEALTRDSAEGLPSLPERSTAKKLLGLPLGLVTAGTSALGGLTGSFGSDPSLATGVVVNTLVAGGVALGLVMAPGLSVLAGPLLGVAVGGAALTLLAHRHDLGERFRTRQYNDRATMPDFEPYGEPSGNNVANRRQAHIEGAGAGLKNGAIEGFTAGSRLTDPVVDAVVSLSKRAYQCVAHLPEKLGGIIDGFRDQQG